jgi:hypothetical protein
MYSSRYEKITRDNFPIYKSKQTLAKVSSFVLFFVLDNIMLTSTIINDTNRLLIKEYVEI